jgi:putative tryptophan/tyrosine transport system substrate-binding protein
VNRRAFIRLVGGAAAAWPRAARAQQQALPVVALINAGTPESGARYAAAFRSALAEAGVVEGQNVAIEYHWLEGRNDRVPALIADLVRRRVAVIATPGFPLAAVAAKAATSTIPIVFGTGDDPVRLGLVTNLARPDGNATGINFFAQELTAKRLGLFHDFVPKAARIAVLINPTNAQSAESTLRGLAEAARALGLETEVLKASTSREIDAAFAALAPNRADALFIQGDGFYTSRRSQFVMLSARERIPTSTGNRDLAEVGLLMSYGTNVADMFRQVGIYTASILKGAKPADLPVLQSSKFEFVINLQTARMLGLEVPNAVQLLADEVIE